MHFLHRSLIVKSQQNRIELVTGPVQELRKMTTVALTGRTSRTSPSRCGGCSPTKSTSSPAWGLAPSSSSFPDSSFSSPSTWRRSSTWTSPWHPCLQVGNDGNSREQTYPPWGHLLKWKIPMNYTFVITIVKMWICLYNWVTRSSHPLLWKKNFKKIIKGWIEGHCDCQDQTWCFLVEIKK